MVILPPMEEVCGYCIYAPGFVPRFFLSNSPCKIPASNCHEVSTEANKQRSEPRYFYLQNILFFS